MKTKRALLQIATSTLPLLFVIVLGWFGYRLSLNNNILGIIFVSVSIVFIGWFLLSVLQPFTKHSWFVVLLFFILCVWGAITYQPVSSNDSGFISSFIEPLNKALSVFFPSRGSFDDKSEIFNHISYQLLHLSAYFFFALFFFSIFGRRLINSSRRFLIHRSKKNIFWGDSRGGTLLANDILNTNVWQQVIFVFPLNDRDVANQENELFEKIDAMGGIVMFRDFDTIRYVPQGFSHYFLCENQDFNLKMALKVAAAAQCKKQRLKIYLRSEMPGVDYMFRKMTNIDLHILNQSNLCARQFVLENPLLDLVPEEKIKNLTVDFDFNVLILGLGWLGRELLKKTICDAQFMGSKFSATVIDKNIDFINGEYRMLLVECINEYNVSFVEDEGINNIGSKEFFYWLRDNYERYDRIIVALGDDALNFNMTHSIANVMIANGDLSPQKKLFTNIKNIDKYLLYSDYPITMFGRLDRLYTCDVIIAERMDNVAKAVNYVYWNYKNEDFEKIDWKKAENIWVNMCNNNSTFAKNSSRAVSMNVRNIIRISGGREGFDNAVKNTELLEILSKTEHLRWNAFHFTEGITVWEDIADDNPHDAKLFKYPNEKAWLLKHACLVKYSELDRISEKVNDVRRKLGTIKTKGLEDYKEIDRMVVRHFGLFFDILTNVKE